MKPLLSPLSPLYSFSWCVVVMVVVCVCMCRGKKGQKWGKGEREREEDNILLRKLDNINNCHNVYGYHLIEAKAHKTHTGLKLQREK